MTTSGKFKFVAVLSLYLSALGMPHLANATENKPIPLIDVPTKNGSAQIGVEVKPSNTFVEPHRLHIQGESDGVSGRMSIGDDHFRAGGGVRSGNHAIDGSLNSNSRSSGFMMEYELNY